MSLMAYLPEPKALKIEMFHCTFCKKSFYYKRYLQKHIRRMHDKTSKNTVQKKHKCNLCDKSFISKSSLWRHRINTHSISVKKKSIKCQEESCSCEFSTLSKFRYHLDTIHNFADYNVPEKLRFNSLADYIKWLTKEENNMKCKFIRPRGQFKTALYTGINYICSQNKFFFSNSSRQTSPKIEDPQKTKFHCTAQILVKVFSDHVEASYFKRHYRHDFFYNNPKLLIRRKKNKDTEKKATSLAACKKTPTDEQCPSGSANIDELITLLNTSNDKQYSLESDNIDVTTVLSNSSKDEQYSLQPDSIGVKITLQNSSRNKLHSLESSSVDIRTISPNYSNSKQYLPKPADARTFLLNSSSDLYIQSFVKQLSSINSKLLSKTSLDIRVAFQISESLKTVEQLLDYGISSNNIMTSCKIKEPREIFVSTSPKHDHDYNKM